jgi:hypothetical protein
LGNITPPEQHRGRRAGDAVHVVVFGHPETAITETLDMLRQRQGIAQRLGRAAVITDRREVEGGNLRLC